MYRAVARTLAAVVALALSAPALADPVKVISEAAVTEYNAHHFVVHSERLGRDFDVVVHLPNATVFLPGQKLPAIYALDGGYGLAGPQSQFLSARDVMAPAIIVSVDYPAGQPNLRSTDFLHNPITIEGTAIGGGGAAFEAFLLEDLKRFIEAKYPADPAGSVLFGHSLGATFAANVFARKPDAFAGYILGSLVVARDPGVLNRVAKAARTARGERVFLAVGGAEDAVTSEKARKMRQGFAGMTAALRSGPGVILKTQRYPRANHLSYYPQMILDGFTFVLPPTVPADLPFVALPASTLARYTGVYGLPGGRKLTIKPARDSMVTAEMTGVPLVYLIPNGPDRYYAFASDLDVKFDATGLTLTGRGAKLRAEREKTP
jgi:predicted alpha/beta superfamily hydrolase